MAHHQPRSLTLLAALGGVWTLPNTVLGVVVGLLAFGWPEQVRGRGILAVRARGGIAPLVRRARISATTFGQVVVFWRPEGAGEPALLDHEAVHVRQYLVLGPFFLPVYLACLPFTGFQERHPLERPAYRAGRRRSGPRPD